MNKTFSFLLGLLFSAALAAQGQFTYTTNGGAITLTAYTGAGGAVTIPNSFASIAEGMFDGCSKLTSVTIPNSVTSIGYEAFYYCSALTSISIPNNVTSMGDYAFADCSSLTSVTIPSSAYSIGNYTFSDCSSLTSVTIPNGVTSIGNDAFNYCSGLTSVSMGNTLTSIGGRAFWGCANLASVTIGSSVTSIGYQAFGACSGLRTVTIPNSVTNIGDESFEYCGDLTNISVNAANPSYASAGGILFDKTMSTLIVYPASLPGSSYVIPNSVTSIGDVAFEDCYSLTSVSIPNSVTSLGALAFYNCSRLTNVTIPNGVASIGDDAFTGCSHLTNVTIGNSVTSIGGDAFSGCGSLTSVYCLGNAPSADTTVFASYNGAPSALVTVYYLPGATGWSSPFAGRPAVLLNSFPDGSLQVTINPPGAVSDGAQWQVDGGALQTSGAPVANLSPGNHTLSFTTIPNWATPSNQTISVGANSTVTASGSYMAQGSLQVTISPAGAVSAGAQWQVDGGTLQNSGATVTGLLAGTHTVSFSTVSSWVTPSNQTVSITANATTEASGIYSLPEFNYTTNGGSITITGYNGPGGAVTIPGAINGLPVTSISSNAFSNVANMTSLTISGSVANIGTFAFQLCTNLTNVVMGPGVASIGANAFYGCYSLTSLYFLGNAPSADATAFSGDNTTAYYLPGTTGWPSPFDGRPAVLWNPQLQAGGTNFGFRSNSFGFNVTGTNSFTFIVEACTNLANPVWVPLQTATLTNGSYYFSDPQWTNYPNRFYGLGVP